MTPEEIRKLLGGYATGTLTAEEQQALFAAALEDQELFDALAREQSLRDLLRDPAARAELLSALDGPAGRAGGFWQWLRHPAVAGLAAAGVVAIAALAVWQGARPPLKQAAPVMVAEMKAPEPMNPVPAPPVVQPSPGKPAGVAAAVPAAKKVMTAAAPPAAAPLMAPPAASAQPAPPAPSAPVPSTMARKAEADSSQAVTAQGQIAGALQENVPTDARALFYANQPPPPGNAFAPQASGGTAPPRGNAIFRSLPVGAALRLGVRVSILRGAEEVDPSTVLDPGETVRLKLIPNADGFLYVTEGAKTLASGTAQRLKPFETTDLHFEGSGQRQLFVVFSRLPRSVANLSLGAFGGGNLVETPAGQERATYMVSGQPADSASPVVLPVTLNYR